MKTAIVIASCEFDVTGIHFRSARAYIGGMQHTLDRLELLLSAPRAHWTDVVASVSAWLLTNIATGIAIGIGVAVGLALAG